MVSHFMRGSTLPDFLYNPSRLEKVQTFKGQGSPAHMLPGPEFQSDGVKCQSVRNFSWVGSGQRSVGQCEHWCDTS